MMTCIMVIFIVFHLVRMLESHKMAAATLGITFSFNKAVIKACGYLYLKYSLEVPSPQIALLSHWPPSLCRSWPWSGEWAWKEEI